MGTVHLLWYGYGGHPWVQKWSKMIFSKFVPRPLGLTHMSPCKLHISLEMGNFGTNGAAQGVHGEFAWRGDRCGVQEEC